MIEIPGINGEVVASSAIGAVIGFFVGRFSFGLRLNRLMKRMEENEKFHKLIMQDRDKYKDLYETQSKLLEHFKRQLTVSIARIEESKIDVSVLTKRVTETEQANLQLIEVLVKNGLIPPRPVWFRPSK